MGGYAGEAWRSERVADQISEELKIWDTGGEEAGGIL